MAAFELSSYRGRESWAKAAMEEAAAARLMRPAGSRRGRSGSSTASSRRPSKESLCSEFSSASMRSTSSHISSVVSALRGKCDRMGYEHTPQGPRRKGRQFPPQCQELGSHCVWDLSGEDPSDVKRAALSMPLASVRYLSQSRT